MYQSSVEESPRLRTPTCQSALLVEVLAAVLALMRTRGSEPVEPQRPTVLLLKLMSYAKLYQTPAVKGVLHWDCPPMHQLRAEVSEPIPTFNSVKCDSKKKT